MASSQNKSTQFIITTVVFLVLFFGFYYFISSKDKKGETTNAEFEAAYVNDGAAYISGIKAENPKKIAVADRVAFSNAAGDGVYYIDNYAKLKYYDIATGDSKDVFINVGSFSVSPSGELIAVTERGESGRLKVITPAGETVADLGTGEKPSWFIEGQRLAFIAGTKVFDASGGDWNARPLYAGNPTDIAVSPDGKTILICERDDAGSRLVLLTIATKVVAEIKKAATDEAAVGTAPLGFSGPRWLDETNEALFIYNDAKGGRIYRFNADTGEVAGVVEEPGPIYSLAVSSKGDRAAYFYIVNANLPKFTEKVDGKEVSMVFGPEEMTQAYIEDLYKRGKEGEIGGEKLNNLNTRKLLDGDVIRIVDLTKGTYWPLGSGQYPVLR
jgi:DNA-binding beta-propeller fold protein YncE